LRLFKETRETSSREIESSKISQISHIQLTNQEEEIEMNGEGHIQRTLGEYSSFKGSLTFNSIVRLVVNVAKMEMKHALFVRPVKLIN